MTWEEPIKVIRDVIVSELGLADDQVFLENQPWEIPPDQKLYIILGYVSSRPVFSQSYFDNVTNPGTPVEIQQAVMHHLIQVNLKSFSSLARLTRTRFVMALAGKAMKDAMDSNSMLVGRIPQAFVNLSHLEAARMLNDYACTLSLTAPEDYSKAADHYDAFQGEFITQDIPLPKAIEFDGAVNPLGGS